MLDQDEEDNAGNGRRGYGHVRRNVVQNHAVTGDEHGRYRDPQPEAARVFHDGQHGVVARVKCRSLKPTAPFSATFNPAALSNAMTSGSFTWPWR